MKKLLSLILLSFIFLTGCSFNKKELSDYEKIIERDILIVGVRDDAKPFGYLNPRTNEYEGFDIDIAKNIALDLLGNKRKIKFVAIDSSNRIEKLMAEEIDIIVATMSNTPQRSFLIDFSKPYHIAGQTALVKKDSDIHTFSDLKKKTTIVVLGSTTESNIRRIIPTIRIVGYRNYQKAFDAFEEGKGDAISADDGILIGLTMGRKNKDYRLLKNRISKELYSVGIRKSENNNKLKNNINMTIIRMTKDGTLRELKEKWNLSSRT